VSLTITTKDAGPCAAVIMRPSPARSGCIEQAKIAPSSPRR
jgi:hypothetical protein